MQKSSQFVLALFLAGGVAALPAVSFGQTPAPASTPQTAPSTTTQTTQPAKPQATCQDPNQPAPDPKPAQPLPPCAAKPAPGTPGADAPVAQQQTVHPKNSKEDVDAIGNRNVGKGVNFYSIEHEIALGKGLAQEVERSSKLIDDPVVVEYVNRVGQNLVRNSDAHVPFTIKVIDSDEVNAFALPGGFFYVNSGLILRAQEESELAGVMAHEISHVTARHGTKQATKGEMMQLATIPLMLLGPGGWAGYGIYQALQLAIPLSYLKFSRDDEKEADFLGLQYMYKAGYDPNAYVTFFERIQADEKRRPGTIPKFFSTHPPTPERIAATKKKSLAFFPRKTSTSLPRRSSTKCGRLRNVMFTRKVQDNQTGQANPAHQDRAVRKADGHRHARRQRKPTPAPPMTTAQP